jgi:protein-tyrosine phosphatase
MQTWIERRGMSGDWSVDSAGTANYQVGKTADPTMQKAALARGYLLETEAKQLTAKMVRDSQLVIAMDRENLREIFQIARGEPKQVKLLSDFLDASWPRDVPDPYRGPEHGFEFVLDMLEKACPAILDSLVDLPQSGGGVS